MTSTAPGLVYFEIILSNPDKVFHAGESLEGKVEIQLERPKVLAGEILSEEPP